MIKRWVDAIFMVISATVLIAFNQYNLLEKYTGFLLIPILISYYAGQYTERKFTVKKDN